MQLDRNQNSSSRAQPDSVLSSLREALKAQRVDAFYLPLADEFQGEYMPASSRRLEWLTGFTGSAGSLVIPADPALPPAFFTDGRYTLQAEAELPSFYRRFNSGETALEAYLADWLGASGRQAAVGCDPWIMTQAAWERFEKAFAEHAISLKPVSPNPIDALWRDRPAPPAERLRIHALAYAGEEAERKRARISESLRRRKADAAFLTLGDSIMWLLNIRGGDVPMTPFALCHAVIHADAGVDLFIAADAVGEEVRGHLGGEVRIHPPAMLESKVAEAAAKGLSVLCDPASTPRKIWQALEENGARILRGDDPCQLPKACKNAVETQGARRAHLRDGLAVTKFLHWLQENKEPVTELGVMERLESFRAASPDYRGPSFTTIAGHGPNGAIVHYRASEATDRALEPGTLLLLDSGGQYDDGTTDITRTIALGDPARQMREDFTRVLKGHIALASAMFPRGTAGIQLDTLARAPLWEAGLDYDHGTGHGVGSYLSVHEGPQRISKKGSAVPLEPGMILSNEPGCYRAGEYGIRIESLVTVRPVADAPSFLGFDTLTCVPIDRRLVVTQMLSPAERGWLDRYHAWVSEMHRDHLSGHARSWLEAQCGPV